MNVHAERLASLRSLMRSRGYDAVVLCGADPHGSEYLADRWKQVEWLSGFSGEAGDVAVTLDHAGLWTDTRYFIQAVQELEGSGFELHKLRVPGAVRIPEWLAAHDFGKEDGESVVIAVDGLCQSVRSVQEIKAAFPVPVRIVSVPDLIEALWRDRPAIPCTSVITLGEELCGESRESRLRWLRKFLMQKECDAILLTALDEIAWLLNVRGSDIDYNPYVISYLLVTMDGADWYVRKDAFAAPDPETEDSFYELQADGVRILGYDELELTLSGLSDEDGIGRIYVDPATLNYSLYSLLTDEGLGATVVEGPSPVPLRKAVKNRVEINGMREIHVEDGLAVERFLYWLENELEAGERVDEWEAARKLDGFRSAIPGWRGPSFETISAWAENAALPHYRTPSSGGAEIGASGLYLVDSGGQYFSGTTDITRTVPTGPCTPLEREDYTLALKGMIALSMAVFPRGTAGCQLDVLARNALWQNKRNFGHGTGHGVGFFLGVHEGPQDIRQNFNTQPLLPGMITSVEPGIYREGRHGVRHENLVLCVEAGSNEFGDWLRFEPLTLCHFDTSILLVDRLTEAERDWLNAYHERVWRTLSPRLGPEISAWLRDKTRAV